MDKSGNPGALGAHGASGSFLADAPDNSPSVGSGQGGEPKSRLELIARNSFASIFGADTSGPWEEWDISCYDIVPDRARTDSAIGSVEMRESLFLFLVHIAESLLEKPPWRTKTSVKNTIDGRYKMLLAGSYSDGWENKIKIDLVKKMIPDLRLFPNLVKSSIPDFGSSYTNNLVSCYIYCL